MSVVDRTSASFDRGTPSCACMPGVTEYIHRTFVKECGYHLSFPAHQTLIDRSHCALHMTYHPFAFVEVNDAYFSTLRERDRREFVVGCMVRMLRSLGRRTGTLERAAAAGTSPPDRKRTKSCDALPSTVERRCLCSTGRVRRDTASVRRRDKDWAMEYQTLSRSLGRPHCVPLSRCP